MFMHSGDPSGQRQADSRHKPVQTAGEGGDSEWQQHVKQRETIRWEKHWAQKYRHFFYLWFRSGSHRYAVQKLLDSSWLFFQCVWNEWMNLFVTEGGTALLDLSGLDTSSQSFSEFLTPTDSLTAPSREIGISLLDDELMSLGNSISHSSHFNVYRQVKV